MTADIKDYFLATPMVKVEYIKAQYKHIPEDIKKNITSRRRSNQINTSKSVLKKGMYDLKQSAILVYDNLQKNLKPFGYSPIIGTVGICTTLTRCHRTKLQIYHRLDRK